MTNYTILKKKGEDWSVAGSRDATSARAAIQILLQGKDEGGTFIAVPTRSWRSVKVDVAQALKFS